MNDQRVQVKRSTLHCRGESDGIAGNDAPTVFLTFFMHYTKLTGEW